jgi:phage terminase small subunit
LKKPEIQAEIQSVMDKRSDRTQVKADDVVKELKLMAFSRLNNYLSWDAGGVRMKDSEGLTDDQIACVIEIQETLTDKSSNIKFKLGDKLKALEMLGKHLGIFAEDNKQRKTDLNMTFILGEKNANPYVPGNRLENVN